MRFSFGDCVLDSDSREILRGGKPVALPPKAFGLLELLLHQRPRALPKDEIYRELWPGTFVADASLANLVARLRSVLGDAARNPVFIRTIPRFGYSFVGRVDRVPNTEPPETRRVAHRLLRGDRDVALSPGENLIGRGGDCAVRIDGADVSRHHARIVIDEGVARLEDLGSKNGTFLREARIAAPVALADGDLIGIGDASMIFRRFDRTAPTATAACGIRKSDSP